MNLKSIGRAGLIAAIGVTLLFSASCVKVNEHLGENLIPTDQKWDVFPQEAEPLRQIRLQMADSLTGYSSTRFTFGAVKDDILGTTVKGTSFTLVPLADTLDFGKNPEVLGFHFSAIRDTLSTVYDNQQRIIQNIYVSALKEPLDSTILYSGAFMDPEVRAKFLNTEVRITEGVPVYDGGDSLSFDFSKEYAEQVLAGVQRFQQLDGPEGDSLSYYLKAVSYTHLTLPTMAVV